MFNVTILKMKDIKKYFFIMLMILILLISVSQYFSQTAKQEKLAEKLIFKNNMISCFSQVIPGIAKIEEDTKIEEQEKKQTEDTLLQGILKTQISSIKNMET